MSHDPYQKLIQAARDAAYPNAKSTTLTTLVLAAEALDEHLKRHARNRGKRLELHEFPERAHSPYEKMFLQAARERYGRDGELEFDDATVIRGSEGDGDYVLGWCWVENEDVSFPLRQKAHLYYRDEEDGALHHLGTREALVLDQEELRQQLLDQFWDDRLDAASCVPHVEFLDLKYQEFHVVVYPKDDPVNCSAFVTLQAHVDDVRPALAELYPGDHYIIQIERENLYLNKYRCTECQNSWHDTHTCTCNDRCPNCNVETEPYESVDIDGPDAG